MTAARPDPAAERGSDRIRLVDLLCSAARITPDLPGVVRGLARLATLKPAASGSIAALIERHAQRRPQSLALSFEGRRWTYAEFNADANRVAASSRATRSRCCWKTAPKC